MTTILDALRNANINLVRSNGGIVAELLGKEQLDNAVTLLDKGYDLQTDIDALIKTHGAARDVPEATYG